MLTTCSALFNRIKAVADERDMNIMEMVRYHGYQLLSYSVSTPDGYKLTLHRIPGPKGEKAVDSVKKAWMRQPVLMLHGIGGSSMSFVIGGPGKKDEASGLELGKAIPYQLVDTGNYDVWLMNFRGNYMSRDHIWLDPDSDEEFWNYTFEEIGEYDVPLCVDFVQTSRKSDKKLMLIGYSQGTTISMYALAENPQYYNERVSFLAALGPALLFENSNEPILKALAKETWLQTSVLSLGYLEYGGKGIRHGDDFVSTISHAYPQTCPLYPDLCSIGRMTAEKLDESPSVDIRRSDPERLEIFLEHQSDGGTSTKNLVHMAQQYSVHMLQKFDYGPLNYPVYFST